MGFADREMRVIYSNLKKDAMKTLIVIKSSIPKEKKKKKRENLILFKEALELWQNYDKIEKDTKKKLDVLHFVLMSAGGSIGA